MLSRGIQIVGLSLMCGLAASAVVMAQAAKPADKVDVVNVLGCLRQEGADWYVVNAGEPEPSQPGGPADVAARYTPGKNRYRLIGLTEFDPAGMKDKVVAAKGLLIKATPASRVNLTSLRPTGAACPAAK